VSELAPILEITGVTVRFGDFTALSDVSMTVERGEIVGLIGPNGAGKSTLLDVISGFTEPSGGQVRFRGEDVSGRLPYQRAQAGLGRSFQDARLYPTMTVREVLRTAFHGSHRHGMFVEGFGVRAARREEERIAAEAESLLDLVDLSRYLDHRVAELSFGTTRAVELAWVAARKPELLLLDEPASGLQQSEVSVLGSLIQRIRGEAAVIVVDHDVPFVGGLAGRLVALDLGRVVTTGPVDAVLSDRDVVRAYLGDGRYLASHR